MRLVRWFKGRPFLTALLVLLAVVMPGYIRVENLARANRSRIIEAAEIQARLEADRLERLADSCERSVAGRDDNRAMWLYLVETNQDPTSPRVVAFVEFLNDRLPALRCDGDNVPVPVEGD